MRRLLAKALRWEHVGSRVTCDPAPTDTDDDYLLLVRSRDEFGDLLVSQGYTRGGSLNDATSFLSYKKGDINLILTDDLSFYTRFLAATSVAKRLNLMDETDRIALFQAVLYANY